MAALLAGSSLLVTAPGARADTSSIHWADFGPLFAPSTVTASEWPFVLTQGTDTAYLFFVNYTSVTSVGNLIMAKYAAHDGIIGTPVRKEFRQVNDVANVVDSSSPLSGAIDDLGNIYIAWTRVSAGAPAYSDIYVSKSIDGGNSWLPAVRVGNPGDGTIDHFPNLAIGPSGAVDVSWATSKPSNWFYNIEFASSTNGGNSFTGAKNISGQGPGGQALVNSMVIDPAGRIYVSYTAFDGNINATPAVHVNLTWSDDGSTWSAPKSLTPDNGYSLFTSMAVDARGRVHIAWLDETTILTTGISIRHTWSDDRGATWSTPLPINQGNVQPNTLGSLAAYGDHVMYVVPASRTYRTYSVYGMEYLVSSDRGFSWDPEQFVQLPSGTESNVTWTGLAVDTNGTFWAGLQAYDSSGTYKDDVGLLEWNGPPSAPVITSASVPTGGNSATITWTAPPEGDVVAYSVWRSTDGTHYSYVGQVSAPGTRYVDGGLANGTYWYEVEAVDTMGSWSVPSQPASVQVGPTLQQQISQLQAALSNLIRMDQANMTALLNQIKQLQDQLNTVQTQQSSGSTLNTALEGVIVALLVVILVLQLRKRKPTMMMAPEPGMALSPPRMSAPSKPEDDL